VKRLGKRMRIFLIVVWCLIVLVVAVRLGSEAILTAKLKRMASDMGLSWPPRVTPSPIADSENAATVYRMAWKLIEDVPSYPEGQDSDEAKREAAAGDSLFDKLEADDYDNLLEDIELLRPYLARQEEGLKLLVEAASRDKCDFNVDYSQGFETDLSHLANSRRAARVLGFAAVVAAADGDADAAAKYSWALFTIGNHLAYESLTISQLVRCAIFGIGYGYLGDVSSLCGIPPEWRARLSKEFSRYTDWDTWVNMTYERIMALADMETWVEGKARFGDYETLLARPAPEIFAGLLTWLLFDSRLLGPLVAKMNAIKYLQLSEEYDQLQRNPSYQLSDEYWAFADEPDWPRIYAVAYGFASPWGLARARGEMRKVRAKAIVAQVGLALSTCKDETGSYPGRLSALAPTFLDEVPLDPYSDEPLIYRREGEGFVVYSVGYDGEDDGGVYEEIIRYTSSNTPVYGIPPEKDDIAWRTSR